MNTSPKASPGIRAAAIVALIGSGLSILLGVIEIAMTSIPMPAPAGPAMPPGFMKFGIFFAAAMSFGFGAWGISSAIGLLRLRNWARISTIAYSAILVSFAFLGIVAILTVPLPPPPAGQFPQGQIPSPEAFAKSIRFFMAAFYLVPIAVGVWWLIFFTRPRVKAQFFGTPLQSQQPPAFPPHPCGGVIDIDTDRLPPLPPAIASRRPISLSIIGWYMIAVGFLMLPAIPFMRFPALVLGWSLTGRPAMFFYLVSAIVVAALGYGILELKPISRPLAIAYFVWGAVNSITMAFWPGSMARMQSVMDSISPTASTSPAQAAWTAQSAQFGLWFGAVFGALFSALIIWFLIREKSAFDSPRPLS